MTRALHPTRCTPRSLNSIIEQMEKFSSSLHELSSRVEASHLSTSQAAGQAAPRYWDPGLLHPVPADRKADGGQ